MKLLNVCYSTNAAFLHYTAVSVTSLLENNTASEVVVNIIHSDLDNSEILKFAEIERKYKNAKIHFHKIEKSRFEKFSLTIHHITLETYYRYLLPEILPDIDKALYLDGDTIVNGDISALFDIDLTDCYCAGVEDIYIKEIDHAQTLGIRGLYINAGVILFNLEQMRANNVLTKLIELSGTNSFKYQDQDAINIVFNGKIKELDCVYNFKRTHQKHFPEKLKEAKIIHYIGPNKPWKKYSFKAFKQPYYKYEKLSPLSKKRNFISKLFWIISSIIKGQKH